MRFSGSSMTLDDVKLFVGSTISQLAAPTTHSAAATKNDAFHPKCAAIHGVKDAVIAAPTWLPMFISPETDPDDAPAISAVTDQNELCDRYNAPAPPARTTLASLALSTCDPRARNTPASAIANAARTQRPTRGPFHFVSRSFSVPPSKQAINIAINGSIV